MNAMFICLAKNGSVIKMAKYEKGWHHLKGKEFRDHSCFFVILLSIRNLILANNNFLLFSCFLLKYHKVFLVCAYFKGNNLLHL